MFNFFQKKPAGPPAQTSLEQQQLVMLDMRIRRLELALIELCDGLKFNLDRIDHNTAMLENSIHTLASMTLRPPKDILNNNNEAN